MATMAFGPKTACLFPTLTAAFYDIVANFPDAVAVHDMSGAGPREFTYSQLAAQSQVLAAKLRKMGVRPHDKIPLVVKRSAEMVVGIWAILSCGAQYVPLDGGIVPDSTIQHVFSQSGGNVVLCLNSTVHRIHKLCPNATPVLIEEAHSALNDMSIPVEDWINLATADAGCYIIYTSGTTGKPKGVDVTHKNVTNLVCMSPGSLDIRPGTKVGQVLNISFDMAAWEIFACLCNGGTLVIRGSKWEPTIRQLNTLICTPTILANYPPTKYPNIKVVATAGEPTTRELADMWATHATYWNSCGPTETTIVNTMQKHVVGDELSIGRPTPNNNVYILDQEKQPVPVGMPGIMWAGGHGVSRGYVGLEEKTNECYIPDPFANDGSKMYCTGDLGQWRPDGSIQILGRVDDQVKGFRVELDGVASSMASFPGVSRATALLINGEIHGFAVTASHCKETILEHTGKSQPYYAVPSHLHLLEAFPMTANGKIDKAVLRAMASGSTSPSVAMSEITEATSVTQAVTASAMGGAKKDPRSPDVLSVCSSTLTNSTEERLSKAGKLVDLEKGMGLEKELGLNKETGAIAREDLLREIPPKKWPKPIRNLRKRILIVYRVLFSLVSICNFAVLAVVLTLHPGTEWLATIVACNLVVTVLVRQDITINFLYTLLCSIPKWLPLWIRKRCAKVYHLGGVHSGAGFCATAWLVASAVQATVARVHRVHRAPSIETLVISWLLCALCCNIIVAAWPPFRKNKHNSFESMHRFFGWTATTLFWIKTVLAARDSLMLGESLGHALVRTPGFWLLGVATLSIASSWFWLRKVKVNPEPLSDHAIRLHFEYTIPVNGSFTRISRRPLFEWHSFATIPQPKPTFEGTKPGYSLVVSNAGDWTKSCIDKPPSELWVRGVPTCGVMRIATLFKRVVVIATGSGIGPLLGHIVAPSCPTQLIWSAATPEKTFGKNILDAIHRTIPHAVIHDTRSQGRPDLVRMGFNLVKAFKAEAVIIIANEKITKKVVYGLETRGIPAYGAIWDS
ncbi:Linear gramicidin synthase subunit C [Escovopsis weberi]|uniref:Linear gramicidin synthase subunit C n=1 Tax=Escovopsis weberi TaxID=150374 RepID=A0A0M8N4S4_ESCWE|nr:Linear gramicidin synthase subunit C [Escovopsis weberi]